MENFLCVMILFYIFYFLLYVLIGRNKGERYLLYKEEPKVNFFSRWHIIWLYLKLSIDLWIGYTKSVPEVTSLLMWDLSVSCLSSGLWDRDDEWRDD